MIIVADAHISKVTGNHTAFFEMLAAIERTDHDLIFLGDIFDLWVALPRYEEDIHARFITWCRRQKKARTIGFTEGNHEFFLASERARNFTWCSQDTWRRDKEGALFLHGDQINRKDKMYLIFKKLTKNKITKFILSRLPFGPIVAASIKQGLKKTNNKFRLQMPWDEIELFAESRFAEGVDIVFVGHFHREYCYRNHEQKELHILPDWLGTQKITLYQPNLKKIVSIHWEELSLCEEQ